MILGIDEAGKGPVIGPLVICGYCIEEKNIPALRKLGVKDSKLLSPQKRQSIVERIKELSTDFVVVKVDPKDIDEKRVYKKNFNTIEIEKIQEIIDMFEPKKVIVDAFEYNTEKFKEKIVSGIKSKPIVIAENYADQKYIIVSAASIIAKVERDSEIEKLKKQCGYDFGTGYPSDPKTIEFLKEWFKNNSCFPAFVRKSWITAKEIKNALLQKSVTEFKERGK